MDREQWEEFLGKSRHSSEEWTMAHIHANFWPSCAVGSLVLDNKELVYDDTGNNKCFLNVHSSIPKMLSETTFDLGMQFSQAIEERHITEANRLYKKIHKKEVTLI